MNVPDLPETTTRTPRAAGRTSERVVAWRPGVAGVSEVLHAAFVNHIYPAHTHDTWTLLIVEDGAIRYDLHRSQHGAVRDRVTVLPPHVPHTGRAGVASGFRKRVLYLDDTILDDALVGAAVDQPTMADAMLRQRVVQLHRALAAPGEELEAESRLALVRARLHHHLGAAAPTTMPVSPRLAEQLRDLLDSRVRSGLTLREAAGLLGAHPDSLVRTFTTAFGIPPHRYLISRRINTARRLLLAGQRPADVATEAGFADQAHLTRHFARQVGTTPARYARRGYLT